MSEFRLKDIPKRNMLLKHCNDLLDVNLTAIEAHLVLLKTASELSKILEKQFSDYGVSDGRFAVLMTLYDRKEQQLVPSEISDYLNVTRATVTGLLDGLERDGLIERLKHPTDRRMLKVRLTAKGISLMDELVPEHYRLISKSLGVLDESSLNALILSLNSIRESLIKR